MLRSPRKQSGLGTRLFKGFLIVEIAGFFGAFYLWNRMNRSQDFRKYMRNNYPYILDSFYNIGEKLDQTYCTRNLDLKQWELEDKRLTGK